MKEVDLCNEIVAVLCSRCEKGIRFHVNNMEDLILKFCLGTQFESETNLGEISLVWTGIEKLKSDNILFRALD